MQTETIKSRFKEKEPCTTKNYIKRGYGRPYGKAISLEGREAEVYKPEVSNSGKLEVSSLELINGTITSIKVFADEVAER